jgi:crossover junction endodeoxyribonuclease RuvC
MTRLPAKPKVALLRVLGIDPACTGPTGYAVIETDPEGSGRCRALRYGAWRPARGASLAGRLRDIHKLVAGLVAEFAPGAVAVESAFAALNVRTALQLAEVRGVVMLAAAEGDIPVKSYSPREVKASLTGYGQASKEQMQEMVRSHLCLAERPEPSDAADALAIALCHIQAARAQARMAVATAPAIPVPRAKSAAAQRASRAGAGSRAVRIPVQGIPK